LHRRCVSCQCIALRDNFWRVVRVPIASLDNSQNESAPKSFRIQLDDGMGRSAYVCKKLECLQIAQKKNRLGRSLRTPISPEIFDILKSRI
jgi:predicted RNA-binding protein YlxR (DUF448 family)